MHWRGGGVIEREGMRERKERGRKESSVPQQNPYLLQDRRKELRSKKSLISNHKLHELLASAARKLCQCRLRNPITKFHSCVATEYEHLTCKEWGYFQGLLESSSFYYIDLPELRLSRPGSALKQADALTSRRRKRVVFLDTNRSDTGYSQRPLLMALILHDIGNTPESHYTGKHNLGGDSWAMGVGMGMAQLHV
ncbi:hypothetical protein EVAR_21298_1 [Eumeta japonica]|uniref:Uncharacterized protein n=1 Tax=Eumeta variegata TaxID=151549 RepID=A0A4C1WPY3_EUMVA|nr:hypothetical protein EVAR_21298_1 [Eumeta japonica]